MGNKRAHKHWIIAPIVFFSLLGINSLEQVQAQAQKISTTESSQTSVATAYSDSTERSAVTPETSNAVVTTETSTVNDSTANSQEQTSSSNDYSESSTSSEEMTVPVPTGESTESTSDSSHSTTPKNSEQNEITEISSTTANESTVVETEKPDSESTKKEIPVKKTQTTMTVAKVQAKTVTPKVQAKANSAPTIAIYRVYNPNSGEHLHTKNANEKDFLVRLGWRYEGVSMRVGLTGRDLYRIYNPNSGEHFFTLDTKERDNLKKHGWRYEGIAWYTPWAGMPMYRVYNPNSRGAGAHHYTMLLSERNHLIKVGWRNEGISWYTLGGAQPITPVQRILSVPYVSQYVPLYAPYGCAGSAMTMILRYKGKKVDLKYVQDHLPMYPKDKGGQKGNVYTGAGFSAVITPSSLANYAKKWYSNISNISGVSTQGIVDRIIGGNPVIYYGYSSWSRFTSRNHCKVIVGYKDNHFLVQDPLYFSSGSKAGSGGGPKKEYDRGAIAWVSITDFSKEWDGRAVGIG